MAQDEHYMGMAISEAKKALDRGDYPCGSVIVRDGKIIAKAGNSTDSTFDVTAHSEMNAFRKACKKLKSTSLQGCTLYSAVEPCLMCAKAAVYADIKRIVYGTEHMEYGEKKTFDILKQSNIGKGIEVRSGVNKEQTAELLQKWLRAKKQ